MEILGRRAIGFLLLTFCMIVSNALMAQQYNAKTIEDAFESSYLLQEKANYTGAIGIMKTVYDENSYEVNVRLGWLSYLGGFFTESAAYYQKGIKLKPYSIEAKLGFVYPAAAIGNWDQVIAQYNDILKIDPQNSVVNYRMGSIYYGKLDYATAEKYLEKVVNLYPFDYDSNILFAWTNLKLGKTREAQVLFHKVLMMRPNDTSAMEGLSYIK
jgi:tetratricopeptide (TPR) repeat protein